MQKFISWAKFGKKFCVKRIPYIESINQLGDVLLNPMRAATKYDCNKANIKRKF